MQFAVVAHRLSDTNLALARPCIAGVRTMLAPPRRALLALRSGDVALARLDVRESLDGVEDGLRELESLAGAGVTVLNPPTSLLAAHDKLLTARVLRRACVPHPQTTLLAPGLPLPDLDLPVVLKPRFGSWGRDVRLCRDRDELERALEELDRSAWFHEHGALAQALVPPLGYDLRLVVAAGRVVGAARRDAAPGEWRTNAALGATVSPVAPPANAVELALAAAAAGGADLVGVDLLPLGGGGWTVLELNGAVDFRPPYALAGDVFATTVRRLLAAAGARAAA